MNAKGVTRLSQNWYVVSTTNMTRKNHSDCDCCYGNLLTSIYHLKISKISVDR